jgi:hypothetical protein
MYEALRKGATVEALHRKTYIKAWFIEQMKELVELEEQILSFRETRFRMNYSYRRKKMVLPINTWPFFSIFRKRAFVRGGLPWAWKKPGIPYR